jgi:hypothetical protein
MALENIFSEFGVAERWQKELGCSRVESTGADGGSRNQRDLVSKINERALRERLVK